MLRYECSNNPFEMRRNTILDFIRENTYAYVGDERKMLIEAKAAEIMQTGVKFKDACHVASAVYAKCEYFIVAWRYFFMQWHFSVVMVLISVV